MVLRREPWSAVATRVVGRAIMLALGLWLAGVPGTPWTGEVPWLWLRITIFAITVLWLALWVLAIANVIRSRRVQLVCMPTGSLERPRSIQEGWLKVPQEFAIGKVITVVTEVPQMLSRAEPRVTLSAQGSVRRIPLHGTPVETFIADANAALKGRGITLVAAEVPASSDDDAA